MEVLERETQLTFRETIRQVSHYVAQQRPIIVQSRHGEKGRPPKLVGNNA